MKALVLSGGLGERLRPFSYSMPKQLIPIANKPVLELVLADIARLGIVEVGIVVGDWGPVVQERIGDGSRHGLRISYIRQERPLGLADCTKVARDFLGDDDFVMYLGDNVLPAGVADGAVDFRNRRPAVHLLVQKVADPTPFGIVDLDENGQVLRLEEKPRTPSSDLAIIGVYFFTPAIHSAVDAIRPSARGELEITAAIQWLLSQGAEITANEYDGYWRDAGQIDDVLECNRRMLMDQRRRIDGVVDVESRITGAVTIEAGARVARSRILGPAVIGADTVLEDCHIGPNTSVGDRCRLTAVHVEDSVVMSETAIRNVAVLRESLIGRGVSIEHGEPVESEFRLVLGDRARLRLGR
ncbi:glucose-1-phosphate thymidylyltransferase [Micromonospora chersina]|uniref:glucose-1-phosphate thymidylyltransferase n=1 Tax=Micromonospora chersina TaxID=47854 RepID=UPI0033C95E70